MHADMATSGSNSKVSAVDNCAGPTSAEEPANANTDSSSYEGNIALATDENFDSRSDEGSTALDSAYITVASRL